MEMKEIQAIDFWVGPMYYNGALARDYFQYYEFQVMARSTFAGVAKKMGIKPGDEWKVLGGLSKSSIEEVVVEMDEVGVEHAIIVAAKVWSWREHALMMDTNIDEIAEVCKKTNGRVLGGASYNPFRIRESLEEVEKAVKEYGFKHVWAHPISFGMKPSDRRMYPLYAKCSELGVAVSMQVGHSAEPLPSEEGHPMYADHVAIDFPELTIILTHTGWPWIDEWQSMLWRHPNVYGGINAYYPSSLDPSLVRFMDTRGQDKVLWGSHGFGMTRCKKELLELPIKDETKRKVLRENAIKALKLG
jgi:predicted TIM-barrel fold metal-dependent hydrolase